MDWGSGIAVSCGAVRRCGLDPKLLWHSSDSTPSLETSVCHECGPKRQKIKKFKNSSMGDLVVQQEVKDPALSLQGHRFHPWPRNRNSRMTKTKTKTSSMYDIVLFI